MSPAAYVPDVKTSLLSNKAQRIIASDCTDAVHQLVQDLRSEPAEPGSPLQVSGLSGTCRERAGCAGQLYLRAARKAENLYSPKYEVSILDNVLYSFKL